MECPPEIRTGYSTLRQTIVLTIYLRRALQIIIICPFLPIYSYSLFRGQISTYPSLWSYSPPKHEYKQLYFRGTDNTLLLVSDDLTWEIEGREAHAKQLQYTTRGWKEKILEISLPPFPPVQKSNSWKYNFVAVSGNNIESSQSWKAETTFHYCWVGKSSFK